MGKITCVQGSRAACCKVDTGMGITSSIMELTFKIYRIVDIRGSDSYLDGCALRRGAAPVRENFFLLSSSFSNPPPQRPFNVSAFFIPSTPSVPPLLLARESILRLLL